MLICTITDRPVNFQVVKMVLPDSFRGMGYESLPVPFRFSAPTSRRLNVVVRSPPLYSRGGPKWRDNYPEGPDHPVAPNRFLSYRRLG